MHATPLLHVLALCLVHLLFALVDTTPANAAFLPSLGRKPSLSPPRKSRPESPTEPESQFASVNDVSPMIKLHMDGNEIHRPTGHCLRLMGQWKCKPGSVWCTRRALVGPLKADGTCSPHVVHVYAICTTQDDPYKWLQYQEGYGMVVPDTDREMRSIRHKFKFDGLRCMLVNYISEPFDFLRHPSPDSAHSPR
ncbi:hypothetical protein SYNPS1DRAFT_27640 [Syncephalis pseudoplumigaleata]|uniref:Uncharacterized protein n=1 Tax=Syncephalis pseudoplumigaleata TaxID=1712513 RepID=A0A4P9Z2Q1_9FUNG|nr:hypothetical protein SYNPS1DRAFT_27640 [Syncephalis pseudoplumigaleata]|eukprot:RKP26686.1 hypothetical protein SYNPS1DRAFT_27640 [Syncephalis pseudoplumigaleata]